MTWTEWVENWLEYFKIIDPPTRSAASDELNSLISPGSLIDYPPPTHVYYDGLRKIFKEAHKEAYKEKEKE